MLRLLGASFLSLAFVSSVRGDIVLFPWSSQDGSFGNAVDAVLGFGNSQPISSQCASALNQTVQCDPQLQALAASGYMTTLSDSLCSQTCNSSLVSYRNAVTSACGAIGAFDSYPNTWRGDSIYEYFNLACDKDPQSGKHCSQWLSEQMAANNGNPAELESLPDSVLCSHCQINSMRIIQQSVFLGYNDAMVSMYQRIFNRCNAGSAVSNPKAPPEDHFPNSGNGTERVCLSGQTHTARPGDTCHSIAVAKSVAEDTLASINDLGSGCNLLQIANGTTRDLCLPQTCETVQTQVEDGCWSLADRHGLTFAQFIAYNPAINLDCTNLRPNGTVVCVSSPDGTFVPGELPASNSSWTGGEYADVVVEAPGPVPFGTTSNCGFYYLAQIADTCTRISLAARVSVDLFRAINPSIDEDCTNLVPDLWYCAHPIEEWDYDEDGNPPGQGPSTTTSSSATVAPPAPTPPGSSNGCFRWHVVVPDDTCALLQNTLGVTFAQLRAWNPDIDADCNNLMLGIAYCVRGPPLATTTTPSTRTSSSSVSSTRTSTSATTTSSPPTSSCAQTYTVASGDWCSKIWEQFSLSETQFRALNPALNANCDLDIGQVLCVRGPVSPPTTTSTTTPPPTQTGDSGTGSCGQTYTVVSGDWCSKIWDQFNLSEAQFRALNPTVNANCDLDIGQVVCVAAPTCRTTYTVVSGDWCARIWERNGLTEAQFRALNPSLNANCDLDIGQVVCVG